MQNIVSLPKEVWPPQEKHRLFSMIERYRKGRFILLSGDIHFYQYYKAPCPLAMNAYYLHQVTSSGLSHVGTTKFPYADKFIEAFSPKTYMVHPHLGSKLNFGVIEVYGPKNNKTLSLQIRGLQNKLYKKLDLQLNDLNFNYVRSEQRIFDCRMINFHNKLGNDFMTIVNELFSGQNLLSYGVLALLISIFTCFISLPGFVCYRLAYCLKRRCQRRNQSTNN